MRWGTAIVVTVIWVAGCQAPQGPLSVSNPDLSRKIPAIEVAVQQKDLAAAEQLVADLQSDDPAIRFYSIEGLRRLTGQELGYVYYESESNRRAAVKRWQRWLADQPAKTTGGASSAASLQETPNGA